LDRTYILTLGLDGASFDKLQAWRTRYFPPALNYLPAHLTLLHTVSLEQVDRLRTRWPVCEADGRVPLIFRAPRHLGRGVAIEVESAGLVSLRTRMIGAMAGEYTRQDQQPFRAHVTVQNKVVPEEAKALFDSLRLDFEPWTGYGTCVLVWRYLGGPWELDSELACGQER
jgi:2'-5' RNA ligase superfamily